MTEGLIVERRGGPTVERKQRDWPRIAYHSYALSRKMKNIPILVLKTIKSHVQIIQV